MTRLGRHGRLRIAVPGVAAAVVLVIAATGALVYTHMSRAAGSTADRSARTLAERFLHGWVDSDGRVVRPDQGGDSVSEGQAYGMLLAVAAGDQGTFRRIWTWTRTQLRQSDGLLAWRWVDGRVADRQSAADADVDAAQALFLAGTRFHDAADTRDAQLLAAAVMAHDTAPISGGRLLAAGPWAVTSTVILNPSYVSSGAARALAGQTSDARWNEVGAGMLAVDSTLLSHGRLPPDWAAVSSVRAASAVAARSAPTQSGPGRYGLDAPRLLIRLATSCDQRDRALAASTASTIGPADAPAIRGLDGRAEVTWRHPITAVAVAAVDTAAGHKAAAVAALAIADKEQASAPTYYGAAWVALGQTLLTTNLLANCPS